jgi:hypothetical protein
MLKEIWALAQSQQGSAKAENFLRAMTPELKLGAIHEALTVT